MSDPSRIKRKLVDALTKHEGQPACIIDADPFPEFIREAFSDIPEDYTGHALIYNINMETVTTSDHWTDFQNVWLKTYSDNSLIESVYILLPVQDEDTMKPCEWTSIAGLTSMVEEYGKRTDDFPADLKRLRKLCRKTHFCVVPYPKAKKETSGFYAFCLYLVLPRSANLLQMLEQCVNRKKANRDKAITRISAGVQLILGTTLDSPYTNVVEKGPQVNSSYKFILVIPQVEHFQKKDPCIIKEHVSLYAKLWSARAKLKVPKSVKPNLDLRLSFLQQNVYSDPKCVRYVPLDYAFLWYHFFLNKDRETIDTLKKRKMSKKLDSALQFLEDIRGSFPGTISDASLEAEIKSILDEKVVRIQDKRRVGDFVMACEESWSNIKGFLDKIRDVFLRCKSGKELKEKEVGFRLWANSDSGKTFLIRQWVNELYLKYGVVLYETSLENAQPAKVANWVQKVQERSKTDPVLAFVDEVDAVQPESTVYQELFRLTKVVEANPPGRLALLIAGSPGKGMDDMRRIIEVPHKGIDLLNRTNKAFSFPKYSVLDRVYIVVARLLGTSERAVKRAELLGLIALAASPSCSMSDLNILVDWGVKNCLDKGREKVKVEDLFSDPESELALFKNLYPNLYKLARNVNVDVSYE